MSPLPKPPKTPCGTCPYRKDVPSGIWSAEEYAKLPAYDGDIPDQVTKGAAALFMCHQRDGCLCGGWLASHGPNRLLALRLHPVHSSAFDYQPGVEVFASGAQAASHGLTDIEKPGPKARAKIDGLLKARSLPVKKG